MKGHKKARGWTFLPSVWAVSIAVCPVSREEAGETSKDLSLMGGTGGLDGGGRGR